MKSAVLTALFALAFCAAPADAALVTYYFNTTGFDNGSTVSGSLSIDPDLVADPTDITLAELNMLADYSIEVTPLNDPMLSFTLTDENSTWDDGQTGNHTIAATPSQLTFDINNGSLNVTLDDDAASLWDSLDFLDLQPGDESIMQITNVTNDSSADQRNFGVVTPSFTFSATSVPEPSSLLLAGMGAGLCLLRRRRRSAGTDGEADPAESS